MATSTAGTSMIGSPTFWARRTRNASLKRASVNTLATATTHQ
jgi:hypothetical protein